MTLTFDNRAVKRFKMMNFTDYGFIHRQSNDSDVPSPT